MLIWLVIYLLGYGWVIYKGILYVGKWCASFGAIVENLTANYPLAVSYPQQYHTGTNVNY